MEDGKDGVVVVASLVEHCAALAYRQEAVPWAGLAAIGLLEATRHLGEGRVEPKQRSYLLSSRRSPLAARRSARDFAGAVRTHWQIENTVHWLLDVACREDESRVRVGHAAEPFAVLRRLALHLLRQDTTAMTATCGIKARRLTAGWSTDYLLHILTS